MKRKSETRRLAGFTKEAVSIKGKIYHVCASKWRDDALGKDLFTSEIRRWQNGEYSGGWIDLKGEHSSEEEAFRHAKAVLVVLAAMS